MAQVYDVIVIGAGIVGSATAYNLVKDNKTTLLLEQFPLPHTRGSSHGQTRIIRKAYTQKHYAEMMAEAFRMWQILEKETATKLLHKTGMLVVVKPDSDYGNTLEKALIAVGSIYQRLTGEQIHKQFPMLKFDADDTGIFEYDAGVLMADKCLQCFQNIFMKYGGHLKDGEGVTQIIPGDIITVHTSKSNVYQARSIVITAGPWTNKVLAPLGLSLPLQPQKVTVYYWKQLEEKYGINQNFPTFGAITDDDYYGLPSLEYPQHVKVCIHSGPEIDPDSRDVSDRNKHFHNKLTGFVARHFPYLEKKPSIMESCIYTWTPDEDFILDTHPGHNNIVIGAGFSGHGFKLSPIVGKILSQLACNQQPLRNLQPFKLDRFKEYRAKL